MRRWGDWGVLAGQGMLVLLVLAGLDLAPPAQGRMLLVSMTGLSAAEILAKTIPTGAQPVGIGPVPASLVVSGDRARIVSAVLQLGIVPINGGRLCGEKL